MLRLEGLQEKHYRDLYLVYLEAEPYYKYDYETFIMAMSKRQGFVVCDGNKVIGAVTFSDYIPGCEVSIHIFILPQYHGKWAMKRQWYKIIFSYPFDILKVPRVSAYIVKPYEKVEKFLIALGFKLEGILRRKTLWIDGSYCDLAIYSLLKEEQRW